MGALCSLVLGAVLGYAAATMAAERAISELKSIIERGEKLRKENKDAAGGPASAK